MSAIGPKFSPVRQLVTPLACQVVTDRRVGIACDNPYG